MSNQNLKTEYYNSIFNLVTAHLKLYSEYKNLSEEEYADLQKELISKIRSFMYNNGCF